jgi:hypothetical protein
LPTPAHKPTTTSVSYQQSYSRISKLPNGLSTNG